MKNLYQRFRRRFKRVIGVGRTRRATTHPTITSQPQTTNSSPEILAEGYSDGEAWQALPTPPTSLNGQSVLVYIAYPIPFDRGGAHKRAYNLIKHLYQLGYAVTLYIQSMRTMQNYHVAMLLKMADKIYGRHNVIDLRDVERQPLHDVLKRTQFDCAFVFPAWQSLNELDMIRREAPHCPVIGDTVDLKLLRLMRDAHHEAQQSGADAKLAPSAAETIVAELNGMLSTDLTLTVSQKEADYVDDLVGERGRAWVVPDEAFYPDNYAPFEARDGILLIGLYKYEPNLQALEFMLDHVLPYIPADVLQQHPFRVVGGGLPDAVQQRLADLPGVEYLGWVPYIEPYLLKARVSVVPILVGAGIKNKLVQAMGAGLPTVTTTMGAEGVQLAPNEAYMVEDDPAKFAAQVVRLLQDEPLWTKFAQRGRDYVGQHNSPQVMQKAVAAAVALATARKSRTRR